LEVQQGLLAAAAAAAAALGAAGHAHWLQARPLPSWHLLLHPTKLLRALQLLLTAPEACLAQWSAWQVVALHLLLAAAAAAAGCGERFQSQLLSLVQGTLLLTPPPSALLLVLGWRWCQLQAAPLACPHLQQLRWGGLRCRHHPVQLPHHLPPPPLLLLLLLLLLLVRHCQQHLCLLLVMQLPPLVGGMHPGQQHPAELLPWLALLLTAAGSCRHPW
jgi:hypothetical protein